MNTTTIEEVKAATGEKPQVQKSEAKRWLMMGIKIIASASLIYFLVSRANVAEIWVAVKSANQTLIVLSFLLHGVGYFASSYRWKLLLNDQGYDVSVGYLMRSYAVAMFFNNLLPSTIGGDGYRAYDTAKRGIPKSKALATVLVERFLGMFALMIFAVVAFALATSIITQTENLWIWSLTLFVAMAGGVWLIFSKSGKIPFVDKIWALPGFSLVGKIVNKMAQAFAPFKGRTKVLLWTMLISLIFQLNVIFHYYLISQALDLSITFNWFLVIIPISILIQTLPISINGIGVREGIYVSFLTEMLGKATVEQSLAFSWIAYGMILLLGIVGGIIYALRK